MPRSNPLRVPGRIRVKDKYKMPAYDKKITETDVKHAIAYMRSV